MTVLNSTNPIIIIPAYCPDERLIKLVEEIRNKVNFPIIVMDDGSGEKYKEIFFRVKKVSNCLLYHNNVNKGKGATLKNGVIYAIDKFPDNCGYITCDADGQHNVEDIIRIANCLKENPSSLILGVRDFSLDNVPSKSRLGNKMSSLIFYFITGIRINDTQTGLRGISREHESLFLSEKGDRYELEMNFLTSVAKSNIDIKEVPIKTIYINNNETTHFRAVKDSVRIFSGILKYGTSSLVSAVLDLGLFTFLNFIIFKSLPLSILFSTILARLISGVFNFLINQKWVFNGEKHIEEAVKYSILFVVQMIASGLLVSLLTNIVSNATISKLIIDTILFFISYFIQKNIVFINKKAEIVRKKVI